MEEHDHKCGCGCDEEDVEMTVEDMVEENNIVMNTLIDLLIEKNVISEDELLKKLNAVENEISAEESDEE